MKKYSVKAELCEYINHKNEELSGFKITRFENDKVLETINDVFGNIVKETPIIKMEFSEEEDSEDFYDQYRKKLFIC